MTAAKECVVTFGCGDDVLVGIAHVPPTSPDIGVIVVVGGPQYRVGSHRQFVLLCRAVADAGLAALRFDIRGMGDSTGELRDFQNVGLDIGAAIDALQMELPSVQRIVLWGLCDGAPASLLYLDSTADPRVHGVCLLNPWVRSPQTYAKVQVRHYYAGRLAKRAFWIKLLSGGVGFDAWRGFRASLRARSSDASKQVTATYQQRMARAWGGFQGSVLLVLSGHDLTAKEFIDATCADEEWASALGHERLQRQDLPDADHTFSSSEWQRHVEDLTVRWLTSLGASTGPQPGAASSTHHANSLP